MNAGKHPLGYPTTFSLEKNIIKFEYKHKLWLEIFFMKLTWLFQGFSSRVIMVY
jgi:hypothetical protein